jgi:general secretion pathway protein I
MRRSAQSGFTLIEMLVALAVFSIAALALLRLDGFAVATTSGLGARTMAGLVARNEAALAATDPGYIDRGATSNVVVNGGRRFNVQRIVTPTDDERLVRIDIVAVEEGSNARSMLTMVKRVQ